MDRCVATYVLVRMLFTRTSAEIADVLGISVRSARRRIDETRRAVVAAQLPPEDVPSFLGQVGASAVPSAGAPRGEAAKPDRGGRSDLSGGGQTCPNLPPRLAESLPEDRKRMEGPSGALGLEEAREADKNDRRPPADGLPPGPGEKLGKEAWQAAVGWFNAHATRDARTRRIAMGVLSEAWKRNGGAWRDPVRVAVHVVREWWDRDGAAVSARLGQETSSTKKRCSACGGRALAGHPDRCYTKECRRYFARAGLGES